MNGLMDDIIQSGDEDFYIGGPMCSNHVDSSFFLSLAPRMEMLCPPCKRPRGNVTVSLREAKLKQEKKDFTGMLPDECLYEIFRYLPAARDRSVCACVSKRWLMLQSSMRRSEIKRSSKPIPKPFGQTPNGDRSGNTPELQGDASFSQDSYEELCDDGLSEVILEDSEPTDIGVGSKGAAEKGRCEKQPRWAIGDLSRCLEGKKATDIRLAAISIGTASRGGLGKLLIRGSDPFRGVSDLGLSAIGLGCPALRVLSLWDCPLVGDKGLSLVAKGCRLLEKLDLCKCPMIGDNGLEAIAEFCPNLLTLNIESCPQIGNKSLKAIGQHCPNLISLCINDCLLVSDQGIMSIVSSSTKLMKVKLQAVKVTDVTLAVIGYYCKSLTDLLLVSLQNVTQKGFCSMGNALGMQKLKVFSVTSCRGMTDLAFEAIGEGCPSVKQVSLHKCESLSDKGLQAFTKVAISLENLRLEECNMISHCGLRGALGNCSGKLKVLTLVKCTGIRESVLGTMPLPACESLKSLNVRYCPGFGNGCLALLGRACPQVQYIDLSGLAGISDDGLLAFLESRKAGLVKVNLSGCIEVTDRALFVITNLFRDSLQTLNLDGCMKVTDQTLRFIADCCSALQDLDVSKCCITDNGIVFLASARQQALQILSLSGCMQITDECLRFIAKMGETLLGLNLQHCSGISQRALDFLQAHLWRCDLLV
eukprot:Gb_38831 [translate_table: standard]